MARNQKPLESPNPNPRSEYTRQGTTEPTAFTGEIPKHLPTIPPEFVRSADDIPQTIDNDGNIPDVSPNPKPEYLKEGYTTPVPLPSTNLVDA